MHRYQVLLARHIFPDHLFFPFYPFLRCLVAQMKRSRVPVNSNVCVPNVRSVLCAVDFAATAKPKAWIKQGQEGEASGATGARGQPPWPQQRKSNGALSVTMDTLTLKSPPQGGLLYPLLIAARIKVQDCFGYATIWHYTKFGICWPSSAKETFNSKIGWRGFMQSQQSTRWVDRRIRTKVGLIFNS